MLDPGAVDLDDLAEALADHSADIHGLSWWFNPITGEVRPHDYDVDHDTLDESEDEGGLTLIEAQPSSVGYRHMEDFIALVPDRRTKEKLERAIEGRGAFRRFKDALVDFPELRAEWFTFLASRQRRGAIEWLEEQGLISFETAKDTRAKYPDPPVGGPAVRLSRAIAADLRTLYGERLIDVLVFGSKARGDDDSDSDLDLLVVLDSVGDPWEEHRRMDEVLWHHTLASGTVVSAMPVSRARFESPDEPVLIRARAEAIPA